VDNNTTIPPDLGGSVGPNHIVTALNSQVRIQNKTGGTISTVTLDDFFLAIAPGGGVFDPKVVYDRVAGRWIVTAPVNSGSAASAILIAVSANSDPTGTWTEYSFDADSTDLNWFDYPSIGLNHNWIVVTGNLFTIAANGFMGVQVYVFDRTALYGGTATPTVFNRPTTDGFTIAPAITQDDAQNTEFMVSNWTGSSGGKGYLRLYTITGTPSAPVYTMTLLMPNVTTTWGAQGAGGADFAPQNTVTNLIQTNEWRAQSVVYQGGSVWVAQTAFAPTAAPTHSLVQWWQIDPTTAAVQQFGRVEDPTAVNFYAFPSIAVNSYNDVLLGYSSFSATQFASANYSFRLHTDAASTMHPTVQFKAGLAKYFKDFGSGKNRWGDYTSSIMDPDAFSLWTLQEYAELPSGGSDRWGTEWARLVPPVASPFVADGTDDVGTEPNPSTQPMWESTDIWLRKTQDAAHTFAHVTENAEYRTGTTNPNYVYVEVRNRGGAPTTGTEQLTLYWAKASGGLSWPNPWNGGVYFDPGPNTMLMGGVMGTVAVPVIAAGGNAILEFAWNPPDPAVYSVFGTDQNHFCLLARVTTSAAAPFGMTFPETSALYANVQNNNKIAWKNIEVYDLLPGTSAPVSANAVIVNLYKRPIRAHIRFDGLAADGRTPLFERGTLRVTPDAALREVLRKTRPASEGIRYLGNGDFVVMRSNAILRDIPLGPNEFRMLKMAFIPRNRVERQTGYAIRVTELEGPAGRERVIGGQTMLVGSVKGFNERQSTGGAKQDSR